MDENTLDSEFIISKKIVLDVPDLQNFIGVNDANMRLIEQENPQVKIHLRGETVAIEGIRADVEKIVLLFENLQTLARKGIDIGASQVVSSLKNMGSYSLDNNAYLLRTILRIKGKALKPKTIGQAEYVKAISENTVTLGVGPAGTGKTYLAMAKAVEALQNHEVRRIILTRPAVEAGERLGYLPGTLEAKIDPYLRPLFDALSDMVEPELLPKLLESGAVEVAPLAYMRGRTLNGSFVILDEAQNTTHEQMKMFLTRLGFGSKMVVTGDPSQNDIGKKSNGLNIALNVLSNIKDVKSVRLSSDDVVRHALVAKIVSAYDSYEHTFGK